MSADPDRSRRRAARRHATSAALLALATLSACSDPTSAPGAADVTEAGPPPAGHEDRAPATGASADSGAARVEFDQLSHDFGRVSDVEPLRHAFGFVNAGAAPLEITEVDASCGCTTTSLAKTIYEPGERGEIGSVWEAKGFGSQRKTITVSTSGRPEKVVLTLSAELEPFVAFDPPVLQFGQVEEGAERILRARIVCADAALEVLGLTCSHPHLAAHVIDDPEGGGRLLEAMLLPSAPWGSFGTQIVLDLRGRPDPDGDPVEHQVQIGVSATVHGELVLGFTSFAVGRVDPGASFTSYVEVTRPSGEPFEVVELRIEQPTPSTMQVRAERLEGPAFTGYRLVVDGEAGGHLGLIRGQVMLRTDVEGEPERRLPVQGMVRALQQYER